MKNAIFFASLFVIVAAVLMTGLTTYIAPDEIGVRRNVGSGTETTDFTQGRHWDVPFVHNWYRLPTTVQYVEFTGSKVLDLRTKENNFFHLDVLVPFRILPNQAHKIVSEGYATAYHTKIESVCLGFLRDYLPQLSSEDVQKPEQRERVVRQASKELNARLKQYHVKLAADIVLRAIYFDPPYEEQLQSKQLYAVQAQLDRAKQDRSEAQQATDTVEKGIDKDVAVEKETWNNQIALKNKEFAEKIASVNAESVTYKAKTTAEADAEAEKLDAAGDKAVALAEATGQRLKSEALSSQAGRTYAAIKAAEAFKIGEIELNSSDPGFLAKFGSMNAWREFFLAN